MALRDRLRATACILAFVLNFQPFSGNQENEGIAPLRSIVVPRR
jgi:hypothetical protein